MYISPFKKIVQQKWYLQIKWEGNVRRHYLDVSLLFFSFNLFRLYTFCTTYFNFYLKFILFYPLPNLLRRQFLFEIIKIVPSVRVKRINVLLYILYIFQRYWLIIPPLCSSSSSYIWPNSQFQLKYIVH